MGSFRNFPFHDLCEIPKISKVFSTICDIEHLQHHEHSYCHFKGMPNIILNLPTLQFREKVITQNRIRKKTPKSCNSPFGLSIPRGI